MNKPFSIFAIVCLGIIVYANSLFSSFHLDDIIYIINNHGIKDIRNLPSIWNCCPCRFITFLSIACNYHFNGLNVWGYHLFNIAVHLGAAVLVWWLVLLTFLTPAMKEEKIAVHANIIALLAGLVFVSQPVQVEAVTYIWQRAASMAAFFYLASLCLYVKSRLSEGKVYYILSLVMAVAAMFTKENAITLPLMILLYESSFLKTKKGLDWKYLCPFLLTLVIIPVTMLFTGSYRVQEIRGVMEGPGGISPVQYLLTELRVMLTYIRLVFLPFNLNLDYDYPVFKSILQWPVLISLLCLIGILYGARHLFSKYRLVSFSILWFFLTLLPESSLLPQKDVIFEHRLYLPLVGYSIFLVTGAYYVWGKNLLRTMIAVLAIIVGCYAVMTYQRNKVWRDDLTLWSDAVAKSPQKSRPYNNLGAAYYRQGDLTQAMADYNKAIELDPYNAEAYYNRGTVYARQNYFPQAIADFTKALDIDPKYAEAYNNLGNIDDAEGKLSDAIADYSKAIAINPYFLKVYYNRGLAYVRKNNLPAAIADFSKTIEMNPQFAPAYNNRGGGYFMQGRYEQAIADYTRAIAINPQSAEAYYNRGFTYYTEKKYDKAQLDITKAKALGYNVNAP